MRKIREEETIMATRKSLEKPSPLFFEHGEPARDGLYLGELISFLSTASGSYELF
jgi:hypothetical protein